VGVVTVKSGEWRVEREEGLGIRDWGLEEGGESTISDFIFLISDLPATDH
jgi:hypothetical protein